MNRYSSKIVKKGSARVEVATLEHSGRKFTNLGSVVDHDRGVAYGYPKGDDLCTWDGQVIGTCRKVSSWKNPRGIFSPEVVSYRCVIDGVRYVGRGGGEGMLLRLRKAK